MATSENGIAWDDTHKVGGGRSRSRKANPLQWTVGLIVRLCIWYILLAPIFKCPSHLSELNESSPRICKPYLVVRSHVEPYVLPYYDKYGAPYVEIARPYIQVVNEHVYTPAANVAKQAYDQYGAPALKEARAYGQQQWDAQIIPRLQAAKDRARRLYDSEVAPYVQSVKNVLSPYFKKVNWAIIMIWDGYIAPFYARSRPFIGKTYTSGQDMLATTVMPYAQSTWSSVIYFANSSLWPKLKGLYSENVEPQLVKIGQQLASYREGRRLRKAVDETDSTTDQQARSTSSSTEESQASELTTTPSATETLTIHTTLSPTAQAREKIAADLQTWQKNFAAAVEKGAENLEEVVNEIVDSYIRSGVNSLGESLVTALEAVVTDEISVVKHRINELAESLPSEDAPQEEEQVQGDLQKEIRRAAVSIRDHAHAVRQWHNSFEDELVTRASVAVNSTLDVLDSIRYLGLQEIGMRWAWMEGVTYNDWARYHALKAQSEEWKNDIDDVGMQHARLEEARGLANDILGRGMEVAEDAAKELARLKDVGKWKIAAREASDDFQTRTEPPPPRPKPSKVDEEPESGQPGSEDKLCLDDVAATTHSLVFSASESESSPSQQMGSGDSQTADVHASSDDAKTENEPAKMAWGVAAAESVPKQDESVPRFPEQLQALVDQADGNLSRATSVAGQAGSGDSVASSVSSTTAEITPLAYISSVASSKLSEGLSFASAQLAQVRATATPTAATEHSRVLLDAQRRYYEAVGMAHDRYSAFISSASQAVYGTPTPTGALEKMASKASKNWESLVSTASSQFYGTQAQPLPTLGYVIPQYDAIEQLVSELLVGKEPSFRQKAMSKLHAIYETPYSAPGLSLASSYVMDNPTTVSSAPFEGAQEQLASLASNAGSFASDVVETATSKVVVLTSDDGTAQGEL